MSSSLESFKTKIHKWKPECDCRLCTTYLHHVGFINVSFYLFWWWRMQAIIFKSHSPTFNFNESFTMYAWIHICKNQSCNVNLLRANPTKWPNTLKKFVGKLPTNCLSVFDHFEKLALKGLKMYNSIPGCWESKLPPPLYLKVRSASIAAYLPILFRYPSKMTIFHIFFLMYFQIFSASF